MTSQTVTARTQTSQTATASTQSYAGPERRTSGRRWYDLTSSQQVMLAHALLGFNDISSDMVPNLQLGLLVDACAAIEPECEFAVTFIDGDKQRCAAATADAVRLLTEQQLNDEHSPVVDAHKRGIEQSSMSLLDHGQYWPRFVPLAIAVGFRTMHLVPLLQEGEAIGLLCIYDRRDDRDKIRLDLISVLASGAVRGITNQRSHGTATVLADQLQHALNSRVSIEQAKGVIASRLGVDTEAAFALLRRFARNNGLRIHDAANDVIAGKVTGVQLRLVAPRVSHTV
jgi:hypothetical protein